MNTPGSSHCYSGLWYSWLSSSKQFQHPHLGRSELRGKGAGFCGGWAPEKVPQSDHSDKVLTNGQRKRWWSQQRTQTPQRPRRMSGHGTFRGQLVNWCAGSPGLGGEVRCAVDTGRVSFKAPSMLSFGGNVLSGSGPLAWVKALWPPPCVGN